MVAVATNLTRLPSSNVAFTGVTDRTSKTSASRTVIGRDLTSGHQPQLAQRAERFLHKGDIWIGNDFHG